MRTRAVILAAGRGERLWPLTSTRPKPLLPVLGRPLLQHHIEALKSAGIAEVDLVVGAGAESVLKTAQELGAIARPVYQPVQLGTGDAVRLALGERSGEVVVVYSDVYVKPSVYSSIIEKISSSSAQLVVAARVEDVSLYGEVSVDSAGRLVKISEKPPERRGGLVFAGLLYAEADELRKALKGLGASPRGEVELTDAINALAAKTDVEVMEIPVGAWRDVGTPWDYLEVNREALLHECERRGEEPEDCVIIEGEARIEEPSALEPPIYVGRGASIGPFSHLRGPTVICSGAKVGFASQIKASVMLEGARAPHLNYVGDSVVGERANLGAGTITANLRHDEAPVRSVLRGRLVSTGLKKLGAVIGGGAKTGVNVSIMPGVKIGAGAWIGAGCIVDRDVPDRVVMKCYQRRDIAPREVSKQSETQRAQCSPQEEVRR